MLVLKLRFEETINQKELPHLHSFGLVICKALVQTLAKPSDLIKRHVAFHTLQRAEWRQGMCRSFGEIAELDSLVECCEEITLVRGEPRFTSSQLTIPLIETD